MIALIALLTFLLLARAFRSLLLPLKAIVLNVLSRRRRLGHHGARLAEGPRLGRDLGDPRHRLDHRRGSR